MHNVCKALIDLCESFLNQQNLYFFLGFEKTMINIRLGRIVRAKPGVYVLHFWVLRSTVLVKVSVYRYQIQLPLLFLANSPLE